MNDGMVRRGPDDAGTHVDAATGVALGARRLSIIDVSGGHQPVSNEDGTVWAVLNGEIYNHPGLQGILRERGHTLKSGVDTEVLVHLYEDHGENLIHALEGMYAFAVWDAKARKLLVARDRLGEKPLFYSVADGELAFASELSPLLRCGVTARLDPAVIDQFFVFGYIASPWSAVSDVCQLPPAHLLRWDADAREHTVERYWTPPTEAERGKLDQTQLVEEVRGLLETSMCSRMISDVPLGVFLSGGLDSSLIAALAARETSQLKTFTVGYESGDVSELEPARRVATALGTDHHELVLSDAEAAQEIQSLFANLDQPIGDQALAPLHAVSRLARESVTVAVGGEGADELFGGYPRYRWLARAEIVQDRVPAAITRPVAAALAAASGEARWRRLADVIAPRDPLVRHLDWVTERRRVERSRLYGVRLHDYLFGGSALDSLRSRVGEIDGGDDPIKRFMRLDLEHWLPDDVLQKADRAGMLASLEIRTPFLHRNLVELALTLPSSVHLKQGGKALLRDTLKDVAPEAAWGRSKTAFRVPSAEWLRGELGDVLLRQTDGGRLFSEGWFNPDAVRQALRQHRDGNVNRSAVLWPLLALGTWYEAQDAFSGA